MKPKTVISLLAAVLILAAASYFLLSDRSTDNQKSVMGSAFIKDLPVNEVASITIQSTEDSVELVRGPSVWQVKNRFNYPADFAKISDFLKKIKRLKIGRTFEADDDALGRQALYAPQDEKVKNEQKGTLVTLADDKGKAISDLILGKDRQGAPGGGGQYVRYKGEKTVYLISDTFSFLEKKPQEWLDSEIINIDGQDIAKVSCYAADSNKLLYQLTRKEKGNAPELDSPPKTGTVDSNKVDQVYEALSPLNLEDVSGPPSESDASVPQSRVRLEYRLYDGRIITVYPSSKPGKTPEASKHQVVLTVGYSKPEASASKPDENNKKEVSKADNAAEDDTTGKEPEPAEEAAGKTAEEIEKDAVALNDKLKVWTFEIAKWQYDSFITTKEGLMETKEEKTP